MDNPETREGVPHHGNASSSLNGRHDHDAKSLTSKRGKSKDRPTNGKRRLSWLCAINNNDKYSRLACKIAGALAYKYSDKRTGETFVSVITLAAYVGAEKRAVQGIMTTFREDGFLTTIASRKRGHPTIDVLTMPGEQYSPPAERSEPPDTKPESFADDDDFDHEGHEQKPF
jgi:hypothetical protein